MSFRKKNVVVGAAGARGSGPAVPLRPEKQLASGTRPSPLDGRLVTSTGTSSLDALLAGHTGLPLGTSLLLEEEGTTEFSVALLRYYAAEGLVQGHHVHVLGAGEAWRSELPGLIVPSKTATQSAPTGTTEDKMKIAWRYEALSNRVPDSRGKSIAFFRFPPTIELPLT
jgi:elongator complex protein 4